MGRTAGRRGVWTTGLVVVLLMAAMPTWTAGAQSVPGILVEGSEVVVFDATTVTVQGNVLVRDEGTLVLVSSALVLDQASDYQFEIRVRDGGSLVVVDDSRILSNRFFRITVQGEATLDVTDSRIRGEPSAAGRSSELVVRDAAHLRAEDAVFERVWAEFHGEATAVLEDVEAELANRLRTNDRSSLEVRASQLSFGFRDFQALDDSTIVVTDSSLRGHSPPFASERGTVLVEDSTWGVPGSIFRNFWYYTGTPSVTFRNVDFLQAHYMILQGHGDFVFEEASVEIPHPDEAFGLASTARTIRVEGGAPAIGTVAVDLLEIGGDAQVALQADEVTTLRLDGAASAAGRLLESAALAIGSDATAELALGGVGYLELAGGLVVRNLPDEEAVGVDHLLARAGSTLATSAHPRVVVEVGQLNNECGEASVAPAGLDGETVLLDDGKGGGTPLPVGLGVVATTDVRHTLTVTVTADGAPVTGAEVRLFDALGDPVASYDPAAGEETEARVTGPAGRALFLFAPTGLLTLEVDGAAAGTVLVADCTEVEVER